MRGLLLAILRVARDQPQVDLEHLAEQITQALPAKQRKRVLRSFHVTLSILCATAVLLTSLGIIPYELAHQGTSTGIVGYTPKGRPIYAYAGASASTYYLNATGSDANPCTSGSPCLTLAHVMATTNGASSACGFATQRTYTVACPGDTIVFQAGTYGPQTCTDFNGTFGSAWTRDTTQLTIVTTDGGTVTLQRAANPSQSVQQTALLNVQQCFHVDWKNLTVIGMNGRSDANFGATAGQTYNPHDDVSLNNGQVADGSSSGAPDSSTIEGFTISHAAGDCIGTSNMDGTTIKNNTLSDCGQPGSYFYHGMYLHDGNLTVTGNTITGTAGYGIQYYGGITGPATIANNTITQAGAGGIVAEQHNVTITGNVITNSGGGVLAEQQGSETVQQNVIAGNTRQYTVASCVLTSTLHGCNGGGVPCPTTGFWSVTGLTGVTHGANTELWVASTAATAIRRFVVNTTTGACTGSAGADLTTNVTAPNYLGTVTENGTTEVWVLNNNGTIGRYLVDGTSKGSFSDGTHLPNATLDGFAFDASSNKAYIVDGSNVVKVISTAGANPVWSSSFGANTDLSTPNGIALVGSDLWVTNSGNNTVTRVVESTGVTEASTGILHPNTDQGSLCTAGLSPLYTATGGISSFNGQVWLASSGNLGGFSVYTTAGVFVQAYMQATTGYGCGANVGSTVIPMMDSTTQPGYVPVEAACGDCDNSHMLLATVGSILYLSVSVGPAGTSGIPYGLQVQGQNSVIYNNTLYENGGYELYLSTAASIGPRIENNIIYGSGSADYPWLTNSLGTGTVWDYNTYFNTASSGHDAVSIASGGGSHSLTSDPLFASPGSNFHLAAGSPAIGAGLAQGSLPTGVGANNAGFTGTALNLPADLGAYPYVVANASAGLVVKRSKSLP